MSLPTGGSHRIRLIGGLCDRGLACVVYRNCLLYWVAFGLLVAFWRGKRDLSDRDIDQTLHFRIEVDESRFGEGSK